MMDKEAIKRVFAKNLQKAMDAKGMTQSDLARVVWPQSDEPGADGRGAISDYVNMKSLPPPSRLRQVAKALGTAPEALMPEGGLQAFEQPEMKIEFVGENRSRLKVNAVVTTSTALKVAKLIEADRANEE